MASFFRGVGDQPPAETGTYVYDKATRKLVLVSREIPHLANRLSPGGETITCNPKGETLDFGIGAEYHVRDVAEKRAVMRKHKVMQAPAQPMTEIGHSRRYDGGKIKPFNQFFYEKNGFPLSEAKNSIRTDGD